MARPTRELDDLIRQALAAEETEGLDGMEDLSAVELLTEVFRGRHRRLAALGMVATTMFFVVGASAAVAFANAQELRTMLLYAGTSALSFGAVFAAKVWYWLEMNRLALTREIKRVELRVAELTRRMHRQQGG